MEFTAAHWGAYTLDGAGGIKPLADDPAPSRIGRGWVTAAQDNSSRILTPVARQGWLEGDAGANRCSDRFVELSWDEAAALVAQEVSRVRETYGNKAIFGGSYGWASAGRFHHAQSHLRRFLNMAGGYVGSRETYSHAAGEVLFPHILGLSNRAFQDEMTSLTLLAEQCDCLLAFGGISGRTAQISSAGVTHHDTGKVLARLLERGAQIVNVSPRGTDLPEGDWVSIRPGTDTALMLALSFEIVSAGAADESFLKACTSGWPKWRAYLVGDEDGVAKSADWAAEICDIPAPRIREIAQALVQRRSMIAVNWGMQRADHGEQVIWAALGLACILGQIGQAGTGFAFGYGSTTHVGRGARLINWPSMPQGKNPVSEFIPVARIADMLLNPGGTFEYDCQTRTYPDIRLVYWCGGNPFHHHQDLNRLEEAWRRPETIIVHDHSWTATARRADIVLPATTPLERSDVMMNRRDPSLFYMSPLFDPMGQSRNDYDIFRAIARALGVEEAFTEGRDSEDWMRTLWSEAEKVAHVAGFDLPDYDAFRAAGRFDIPDPREDRIALEAFVRDPAGNPLDTETGKIILHNDRFASLGIDGCPAHPTWLPPAESLLAADRDALHLISGQPDTRLHSQNDRGSEALGDKIKGREPAYLHPDTAADRGLEEGDVVRLYNSRGACLAGLRLDPLLRRDCISLATGAWFDPQDIAGERIEVHGNPNVLTLDKGCSDLSQGNIAHTALVLLEKWIGPLPVLSIDRPPQIGGRGEMEKKA
ncbi:dimethylsulfoxide reductase [Roseobacter cerasinus]|uniref:Dimethylsulfoxide reductase n=1 Tax=Roseobacter cerasinus TaxID=2602289 RepID=A0A640VSM6_9RHOB|nr:molybdopterin-dependent oxidoreductase [Roseobacter cerasinus]GFE51213.1 dimethylsulfoxide reductase [Roseobacter cerasinus]